MRRKSGRSSCRYEIIAWIGARVADALHHAHELKDENGVAQEVVHRDINPSNVFVTYGGHVKIIDFGLAKAVDRLTSTVAGIVKGKLAYMSPEQIGGQGVDRRSDVFSLGTTLWELTMDRRLFKCERDVDTMLKVQAAEVPDPRKLVHGYPTALAAIILRALARDRESRFQTASELSRELDAFAGAGGRIVTPASLLEIMVDLFPSERDRDAKWFEETGLPIPTVPLAPVVLPSQELKTIYGAEAVVAAPAARASSVPAGSPSPVPAAAPDRISAIPEVSAELALASAPTMLASSASQAAPTETSLGEIPGLPRGTFALLSAGELAMFGALGMLVLVAIAVAIVSLTR